jgi:hypothetical protein
MKNKLFAITGFFLIAAFALACPAEARGRGVSFGFSFGVGVRCYAPPVYRYYPAYGPYTNGGYYYYPPTYYAPPVVVRPYVPYYTRGYRTYAPYYRQHGRGRGYHGPRRYVRRY